MIVREAEDAVLDEAVRAYDDEWLRQCCHRTSVDKRRCVSAVLVVCLGRIIAASGELGEACEEAGLSNRSDVIRCAIEGFAASNNIKLES
jgi:hypothetical protein